MARKKPEKCFYKKVRLDDTHYVYYDDDKEVVEVSVKELGADWEAPVDDDSEVYKQCVAAFNAMKELGKLK